MGNSNTNSLVARLLKGAALAVASVVAFTAQAAVPGITSAPATGSTSTFNFNAEAAYITQPDGSSLYAWGYGCTSSGASFVPSAVPVGAVGCPTMQLPGPTLIVNEGQTVSITLTNKLPAPAGNTSMLFPDFAVSTSGGVAGLLTQEAVNGGTVTYTFTATNPGTHSYYSGTQGDLQVEMGLSGAIVVLPATVPANCAAVSTNDQAMAFHGETDFRLSRSAYGNASSCYDREYLFQFTEMDPKIHRAAEEIALCQAGQGVVCATNMNSVPVEPYHPAYFMINGRSMPDNMDTHYAVQYPHQPYNGNPHMHPGELVLLRIIGQGRWQHPFHEHGNHVRVLARDGNLLVSQSDSTKLAGPLLFTTTTTPGQAMDGLFQWTGKGLNWDVFGHTNEAGKGAAAPCVPDANGYHTLGTAFQDLNFYEWCGDHNKALESHPFGNVGSGGPMTLPDPNIVANGPWYSGSPYLGGEATGRAVGATPIPPSGTVANSPTDEAGFAYMWHSHNEREITTNNIFPGGMLMMMLVDPRAFVIDESK